MNGLGARRFNELVGRRYGNDYTGQVSSRKAESQNIHSS
jgi:hypothetical protein